MALELKYTVEENADRLGLTFREYTGAYSTANLGGYGAPNPTVASVIDATITITRRGSTSSYTFPITATSDDQIQTLIPATSFGYASGEKIEDGLYQVRYQVDYSTLGGATQTAFDSFYFAFLNKVKCCISSIDETLSVPDGHCECADEQINSVTSVAHLVTAICRQVACDKLDKAQETLEYVQRYCACHCTTCN